MHSILLALLGAVAVEASSTALAPEDIRFCPGYAGRTPVEVRPESLMDDGSIYRVGSRRWNEEWEIRFGDWVHRNVEGDFFLNLGIPTDCADAAITVRMIFARIHHLPVVFEGGGKKISFETRRFARLPTVPHWDENHWARDLRADRRFLAFVNEVQTSIGTANLTESTYPLALFSCRRPGKLAEHVRPGSVLFQGNHTRFIAKKDTLDPYLPVRELSAGGGRQVKALYGGSLTIGWPMPDQGILGFNWAVDCGRGFTLVSDQKMPFYGLDQYEPSEEVQARNFNDFIQGITPGERSSDVVAFVRIKFDELRQTMIRRLNAVEKARRILKRDPHAFDDPQSVLFDDLSTPSLDAKLLQQWMDIHEMILMNHHEDARRVFETLMQRRIKLSNGEIFTYDFFLAMLLEQMDEVAGHRSEISDPRRPFAERWNLAGVRRIEREREQARLSSALETATTEYKSVVETLRLPISFSSVGIPMAMSPAMERRRQALRKEIRRLARELLRWGAVSTPQLRDWAR